MGSGSLSGGWLPQKTPPSWLASLQPATTGLLGQERLKLWTFGDRAALGIRSGGVVYPVLPDEGSWVPGAREVLDQLTGSWCLMGPSAWVTRAEGVLPLSVVQHRVEYQFLVRPAQALVVPRGPGVVRRAEPSDANALFALQEGYEKEEVLFDAADFHPLASRLHLGKLLKGQEIAGLWENGRPIAKAGTNALTADWAQIGGVYTRPEHRGRGCQTHLMAFLLQRLADQGRGACLFVKKANLTAISLYQRLGFTNAGEFLITYGDRR